jgi:hypothetical protein
MKIATFGDDFTKDLESFVKNPIQIEPLPAWNPRKPAAPERHMLLGKAANIALDTQIYMLEEQNHALNTIESMLRIFTSAKQLQSLPAPDVVKEQAWLFAYKWFSAYYELLTEPGVLQSKFYKEEHDRFLAIVGSMLLVNPGKRATFISALRAWYPMSVLLHVHDDVSEFDDSPLSVPHSQPPVAVAPVESVVSHSPSETPLSVPAVSVAPAESKRTRLVLTPPLDLEGRNKTRKIYRN